ncbi:hypothetical protein ONZ43_g2034 [Nemania bipapillata]|uniref:Uncharacterized protein n=1 Tax=Nemania bipapillata TaxID=110536 RepID=A0ACC2J270_9PEZI|nr:hypothetical protein ONZ43_g2034 [Nemania bipapillata]
MVVSRHLPSKTNHLMTEDIPVFTDLVSRRRLGQTQLTPKMVAASAAGEVDPSALGVFDYAHLRAPLPKGITSGIFKSSPSSYFLMRRSQDGYVSATGMFKATFPYAEAFEEEAERKYMKSLPTTSHEETAGNVWIPPEQAMALAEDPTETVPTQEETEPETNSIKTEDTVSTAPTEDITIKTIEKEPEVVFAPVEEEPKIHIKVGQEVQFSNGIETTHTAVEVELPVVDGPPSAEEAAQMIEKAKEMVAAAAAESAENANIDAPPSESSKGKRKADEIAVDEEEEEDQQQPSEPSEEHRAKKVKTEVQLRKQRVRNRALVGLSATLAVGALIPYVMGVF